jgi:phosphoglycolate phosphatase
LALHLYHTEEYLPEDREIFENHYLTQCTKNVKPYEGVIELLSSLKKNNVKLSVATNAPTKFGEKILNAAGLDHFFDHIIGSCKVKKAKPDPDMIYLIENLYSGATFCKKFFVGDNHTDIMAAKNAKIPSIYVSWGYGEGNGIKPDFTVKNPAEILSLINYEKIYF